MHTNFYVGVVENTKDPLRLGRYQVRVFSVHSESKVDVPTEDLPWAIPLMPVTSASVSGIGETPRLVQGSTVMVFFQDGESKQQPIIMGSMLGFPVNKTPFGTTGFTATEVIAESTTQTQSTPTPAPVVPANAVVTSDGTPVRSSDGTPVTTASDPSWKQKLIAALGRKESGNNYSAKNQLNFVGKYQFGLAALEDMGYVKTGSFKESQRTKRYNWLLDDDSVWTGKGGASSKAKWFATPAAQEAAMSALVDRNEKVLNRLGVINANTTDAEKAGYLAISHLLGPGGAQKFKNGANGTDANGTSAQTYYNLGYSAVTGTASTPTAPPVTPAPVPAAPTNPPAVQESTENRTTQDSSSTSVSISNIVTRSSDLGFSDPDKVYPKYIDEGDTNRLHRNQNIDRTVVAKKDAALTKSVKVANGSGKSGVGRTWSQPKSPYNAKYPHNKVYESESGHLLEFDDTPDNERIHLYHKKGTFTEIDRNGTRVNRIIGDSYEIIDRNGYISVKGTVSITVDGNVNLAVKHDLETEIGGNANFRISGDLNFAVGGGVNLKAKNSISAYSSKDIALDSSRVYLNSDKASTAKALTPPASKTSGSAPRYPQMSVPNRVYEAVIPVQSDPFTVEEAATRRQILVENGALDEDAVTQTPPIQATPLSADEVNTNTPTSFITQPVPEVVPATEPVFDSGINLATYNLSSGIMLRDLLPVATGAFNVIKAGQLPTQMLTQLSAKFGIPDVSSLISMLDANPNALLTSILGNMKYIALNVGQKVLDQFPTARIISGLVESTGSGIAQPSMLGQRICFTFDGIRTPEEYKNIALQLGKSLLFDKLTLNFRTDTRDSMGNPLAYIAVEYVKSEILASGTGRTPNVNRGLVYTTNNDVQISSYGSLRTVETFYTTESNQTDANYENVTSVEKPSGTFDIDEILPEPFSVFLNEKFSDDAYQAHKSANPGVLFTPTWEYVRDFTTVQETQTLNDWVVTNYNNQYSRMFEIRSGTRVRLAVIVPPGCSMVKVGAGDAWASATPNAIAYTPDGEEFYPSGSVNGHTTIFPRQERDSYIDPVTGLVLDFGVPVNSKGVTPSEIREFNRKAHELSLISTDSTKTSAERESARSQLVEMRNNPRFVDLYVSKIENNTVVGIDPVRFKEIYPPVTAPTVAYWAYEIFPGTLGSVEDSSGNPAQIDGDVLIKETISFFITDWNAFSAWRNSRSWFSGDSDTDGMSGAYYPGLLGSSTNAASFNPGTSVAPQPVPAPFTQSGTVATQRVTDIMTPVEARTDSAVTNDYVIGPAVWFYPSMYGSTSLPNTLTLKLICGSSSDGVTNFIPGKMYMKDYYTSSEFGSLATISSEITDFLTDKNKNVRFGVLIPPGTTYLTNSRNGTENNLNVYVYSESGAVIDSVKGVGSPSLYPPALHVPDAASVNDGGVLTSQVTTQYQVNTPKIVYFGCKLFSNADLATNFDYLGIELQLIVYNKELLNTWLRERSWMGGAGDGDGLGNEFYSKTNRIRVYKDIPLQTSNSASGWNYELGYEIPR